VEATGRSIFFEKKKQKTFVRLFRRRDREFLRRAKLTKVFCFFFAKKKTFLLFLIPADFVSLESP